MWKDSETEIDYLDYGYIVDILKDMMSCFRQVLDFMAIGEVENQV